MPKQMFSKMEEVDVDAAQQQQWQGRIKCVDTNVKCEECALNFYSKSHYFACVRSHLCYMLKEVKDNGKEEN